MTLGLASPVILCVVFCRSRFSKGIGKEDEDSQSADSVDSKIADSAEGFDILDQDNCQITVLSTPL